MTRRYDQENSEERAQLRHDLRARLAVIVGYAHLLDGRDDEAIRREAPKRILEAAELLSRELDLLFAGSEEAAESTPQAPRRAIVVADDAPELRALLLLTLPDSDFDVREAGGGAAALELVDADPPGLVVLDWNMPGIPGAEVLQELKRRLPDLPVIVLTAEPRASERQRAEELGADAFLSKPFSPIELLETIERLLGAS